MAPRGHAWRAALLLVPSATALPSAGLAALVARPQAASAAVHTADTGVVAAVGVPTVSCPDALAGPAPAPDLLPWAATFPPTTASCRVEAGPVQVGIDGEARLVVSLAGGGWVAVDQRGALVALRGATGPRIPLAPASDVTRFSDGSDQVGFGYDADGELTRLLDAGPGAPGGDLTTFTYDADGELTGASGQSGTVSLSYDASDLHLTAVEDNASSWTFTYDTLGRLTSAGGGGETATFSYDADGRLVAASDHHGTTSFGYDAAGELTTIGIPNGSSASLAYDAAGELVAAVEPDGTTRYDYDTLGRLSRTTAPGGTTTTWNEDASARPRSEQVVSPDAPATTTTFAYDPAGELVSVAPGSGPATTAAALRRRRTPDRTEWERGAGGDVRLRPARRLAGAVVASRRVPPAPIRARRGDARRGLPPGARGRRTGGARILRRAALEPRAPRRCRPSGRRRAARRQPDRRGTT